MAEDFLPEFVHVISLCPDLGSSDVPDGDTCELLSSK